MDTSSTPQPNVTPHDAASVIASYLSSQGAADVTIWDKARTDLERQDYQGDDFKPDDLDRAAVLASGWADWDIELAAMFAGQFPRLLLEPMRYGILGIIAVPPDYFDIPAHLRRKVKVTP